MSLATPTHPTETVTDSSRLGKHHQRIERLRNAERQRRIAIAGLAVVMVTIFALVAVGVADFYFQLSWAVRAAALAGSVAVVVAVALRLKQWSAFESVDAVYRAEQEWPDLGQRLRTSHDYAVHPDRVSPANPALLDALESETQDKVLRRPVTPLGRSWPLAALAVFCLVAVTTWLATLALSPEWRIATGRLMLLPVHYSQVRLEPLPQYINLGDDLVVRMEVAGRPIESAALRYRESASDEWKQVDLASLSGDELVGSLSAVVPDCQQDLELQILATSFGAETYQIPVRLPLRVEQWQASVVPPEYMGLSAQDGDAEDLRIPEGSLIELAARYNRSPSSVEVEIKPEPGESPKAKWKDAVAAVTLQAGREPVDVFVDAQTEDGVSDRSTVMLNVIPDRPPTLRFLSPAEDTEAIPTGELRFTVEAFDDYGIGSLSLRYRIDDGPEQTLWENSSETPGKELAKTVTLPLEDLDLAYPQAITYYAVATDNRGTDLGRSTTELRFVDIRPFSREYQFQEGQCNCQGECLSLEKLIKSQRQILGQTFAANQNPSADASTIGQKLSSQESELREQTETLTIALEQKVGPLPMLGAAVGWMTDAVDALQQGSISSGQTAEEKALSNLIAARRNLRKILKQSNSASQMVRNVDKQQQDKIRKPESKKAPTKNSEQLADIRKQLEKLAKQQQSFCQSAQSCKQSGSASSSKSSSANLNAAGEQSPPTPQQLKQSQQLAEQETRDIAKQLSNGKFGELASRRAAAAAESIRKSAESLKKQSSPNDQDLDRAIKEAEEAAERLNRLSEHLAQRHKPDFEDKLAIAKRGARQIADRQQALSDSLDDRGRADEKTGKAKPNNKSDADRQTELSDRTEELADLVDQLLADSTDQPWEVREVLTEQLANHPPRQAAKRMAGAADDLRTKQRGSAAEGGRRAAETLQRFATGLDQVVKAIGPAKLQALSKAERQVAQLIKELRRSRSQSGAEAAQRAIATAEAKRLAESLGSLAGGDRELERARETVAKFASSPTQLIEGLRDLDELLQRRIQEAILSGVMQQADGPVPPEYNEMVEEYYRVLSEDVE